VFGFTSMLRKLVREHQPRYLAVAFDRAEPTFRHKAYPEYKANRPETAAELVAQIPLVKDVCRVLGVATLELEGFEADDIIGTLAPGRPGYSVVIVATDGDPLQLVSDRSWPQPGHRRLP
jgi:DNA polymerase-1